MQKILIVTNHMNIGGIQKSLLELLKALAREKQYDVSLFCCKRNGAFLDRIPSEIKVLPENPYALVSEESIFACKKRGLKYYLCRLALSLWSKCFTKALPAKILCRLIGHIGDYYDVAVSYSQPIEDHEFCNLTNEIVLKCTNAKRKVTFVHCDYGSYGGNTKRNRALYQQFDVIATVSDSVGKRFKEIIPELSDRVRTVYNFCDCDEILALANAAPLSYAMTAFVTVARLSEEKGLLRCMPLFARLRDESFPFEWHIVGGGGLYQALADAIAEYKLGERVFLEGEQINPYRYIKNADYFFLPSFHEAAPMVFDEALTLGVPILTTKTLSALEMIEKKKIGLVCENDSDSIYQMLHHVLADTARFNVDCKPQNAVCLEQFNAICK